MRTRRCARDRVFVQRIERRTAFSRGRDQNPAPFSLNQRQRLARRERDALDQRQTRLRAPAAVPLRQQPPRPSTGPPCFITCPTRLFVCSACHSAASLHRVLTPAASRAPPTGFPPLQTRSTPAVRRQQPEVNRPHGSIASRSPAPEPGRATGVRETRAREWSRPAPQAIGESAR